MLFAAGMIFAADTLDDTIKNPEELRQKFGLSILGLIAWHESSDEKPISLNQPRSPVTESFRSLRTNTTFAGVDKPLRRILVTSATPQEGKTTITSNLAVVLAQNEKKVALIDADLRRPQVHRKFGLQNRLGLSDLFLLVRPLDMLPQGIIQRDEVSKLAIITSGKLPPNPAELLTSQKMSHFLDLLNREYDMVLLDTPPVLSVTDAAALSTKVDGTILVAKPGVTKLKDFQQALEQLKAVGAPVLGVVLNEVDPRNRRYGYYYHRYYSKYSNYYGEPDGGRKKSSKALIERRASV
jgi:capsular exopolysaccharide synthesis family protein